MLTQGRGRKQEKQPRQLAATAKTLQEKLPFWRGQCRFFPWTCCRPKHFDFVPSLPQPLPVALCPWTWISSQDVKPRIA